MKLLGISLLGLLWASQAYAQGSNTLTGQITINCDVTSTALLPARAASQTIFIQVPNGVANTVWINFLGAAATTATPSVGLAAGQWMTWKTPGFVPQSAISCISTPALQSISVLYK